MHTPPLLQEITQSPINTAVVVMTFLIVAVLRTYLGTGEGY